VDEEYKSEAEEADQFDSDFNESEARARALERQALVKSSAAVFRADGSCCAARLATRLARPATQRELTLSSLRAAGRRR
jgi:hypothetical protein